MGPLITMVPSFRGSTDIWDVITWNKNYKYMYMYHDKYNTIFSDLQYIVTFNYNFVNMGGVSILERKRTKWMHNYILFLKVEHVREAIKGIPKKDGLYQNLINQNTGQWSSSMFLHVHVHVLEYMYMYIHMYMCMY